jgi:hypothetical protein
MDKFTMKKKWRMLSKLGMPVAVAGLSFTPVNVVGLRMFMLAWFDVEQKHTISELFDEEGNGLSFGEY